jgi:hypothetical protein
MLGPHNQPAETSRDNPRIFEMEDNTNQNPPPNKSLIIQPSVAVHIFVNMILFLSYHYRHLWLQGIEKSHLVQTKEEKRENPPCLVFPQGTLPFKKYPCKHRYCSNILAATTVPVQVPPTPSSSNHRQNLVPLPRFRLRDCHSTSLSVKTSLIEVHQISILYP